MKAVILAGGLGTRLSEETVVKPKPMVEVGGRPILWHVMKIYAAHGINEFIVCCGYKGYAIKEYFANYFLHGSDVTFDLRKNQMDILQARSEDWKVTLIDTGASTMTGGRLKRVAEHLDGTFCFTYGDGVADVDVGKTLELHKNSGKKATLTAVRPPGRFGAIVMNPDTSQVSHFREKPDGDGTWVNGGFFVLEPSVLDYISGDEISWEREPMERLAKEGELSAYRHEGFWQPMDTLRDKNHLEGLWANDPPWKVW